MPGWPASRTRFPIQRDDLGKLCVVLKASGIIAINRGRPNCQQIFGAVCMTIERLRAPGTGALRPFSTLVSLDTVWWGGGAAGASSAGQPAACSLGCWEITRWPSAEPVAPLQAICYFPCVTGSGISQRGADAQISKPVPQSSLPHKQPAGWPLRGCQLPQEAGQREKNQQEDWRWRTRGVGNGCSPWERGGEGITGWVEFPQTHRWRPNPQELGVEKYFEIGSLKM